MGGFFLQSSELNADTTSTLIDQGVLGVVLIFAAVIIGALWRYATTQLKQIATDFRQDLKEQWLWRQKEAEESIKASLQLATVVKDLERRIGDHDEDAKNRHKEILERLPRP